MNAIITTILKEQQSKFKGTYFVIKLVGDDGLIYNIVPSSDCNTYDIWKKIVEDGIGKKLTGLSKINIKNNHKKFFNKKILPKNI